MGREHYKTARANLSIFLRKIQRAKLSNAHTKSLPRVTPFTIVEIRVAESAPSVMATQTTLRAGRIEMLRDDGRRDLLRLRQTGAQVVTIGAAQALPRAVIGVAEIGTESSGIRRSSEETTCQRMTDAARCDVAPVGLRVRRMTGVALPVGIKSGWNSQCGAAARGGRVTGDTPVRGSGRACVVLRVIELRVETAN